MNDAPALRDRVVRDLWWAVTGAEVARDNFCSLVPRFDPSVLAGSFAALDADPAPLHRAVAESLNQERLRLGAYFEDLIRFFVTHIAGHHDATTGVVISQNKRTVGELDLLFREGPACHHWELAVKFYLQVPGLASDPGDSFVGPQTRDRLHFKLARLRDHQVPLPAHPAAAELLAPWQPLQSAALLRGRLFYPASSDWKTSEAGSSIADDHTRGWWCAVNQTEDLLPHADAYAMLTRREWFAPIEAAWDTVTPWNRRQVCAWADEAAATWQAGAVKTQVIAGLDAAGKELHRGFLVSVGWPGLDGGG